jgi:hypothetical protein
MELMERMVLMEQLVLQGQLESKEYREYKVWLVLQVERAQQDQLAMTEPPVQRGPLDQRVLLELIV